MLPILTISSSPTVPIYRLDNALVYVSGLAVDADGAPEAYHPDSKSGLDNLANAYETRPDGSRHWFGVCLDVNGAPIVQGPSDPAPGFLVSPTALVDTSRPLGDPLRYVDSSRVAYASVPPQLRHTGVQLGDVGVAYHRTLDKSCAFVVADVGPHSAIGEGSVALAKALGIPSSARNGGVGHGVTWCIFAGSARGWPRDHGDVEAQVGVLLTAWGGMARMKGADL